MLCWQSPESKQDFWFILLYRLGGWGPGTWPDVSRMLASEGDAPSNLTPCVLPMTSPVRLLVISDHRLWREVESCQRDGVLEAMMKNDHFSLQRARILIKLPASSAQGGSREDWLDKGHSVPEGQSGAWNLLYLFKSVPIVWCAVMNLLINEPVDSIAPKRARTGVRDTLQNESVSSGK